MKPPFNRERFLLFCVAWIIGVQYGVFILAAGSCAYLTSIIVKTKLGPSVPWTNGAGLPYCGKLPDDMKASAEGSLAVLLALLGGGTIAVAEYQRRQPPEEPGPRLDPRDPRNPR